MTSAYFFRGLVFALALQLAACAITAAVLWLALRLLGKI